ncbi:UvrD-helicase domain-containing protein [Streptomyces sp. NPDC001380]|uniref:UvrD-helicase domain-containing protein n=1 Tax=Streptomyces sp. NPDC001380 TaxID=3364566 RepID=UPI0036C619C0
MTIDLGRPDAPDNHRDALARRAEEQQRAAIAAPGPVYIRACPGAGKTHVITSRHLASPRQSLRGGKALISFTRAARDQMARRCLLAGRADLTRAPHFIGTLDSFLWEFLVRPGLPTTPTPRLLESWNKVKAPIEQVDVSLELGHFSLSITITPHGPAERVAWDNLKKRTTQLQQTSSYARPWWEERIRAARDTWHTQGYYTGHEARLRALHHLRTPRAAERFLQPLRSRFAEIVVDEAQDCSAADLTILQRLHLSGMPIVLVGDPDQAIYSWRGAAPTALERFAATLPREPLLMTGNRRSTPTICRLAATLRTGNRPPDDAVVRRDDIPIAVIPTDFSASGGNHRHHSGKSLAVDVFLEHAATCAIAPKDSLVTTYQHTHLPLHRDDSHANSITALAQAHAIVRSPHAMPTEIADATALASRTLLNYWFPDASGSIEHICANQGLGVEHLHRTAHAFLHTLPPPHPDWATDLWQATKSWPSPPGARPARGKGRLGSKPTIPRQRALSATSRQVRFAVIHQVKGEEADAVFFLLPKEGSVRRWIDADPAQDETLRVWYVAATRARRLLAIGVRSEETPQLTAHLTAHRIAHTVL